MKMSKPGIQKGTPQMARSGGTHTPVMRSSIEVIKVDNFWCRLPFNGLQGARLTSPVRVWLRDRPKAVAYQQFHAGEWEAINESARALRAELHAVKDDAA